MRLFRKKEEAPPPPPPPPPPPAPPALKVIVVDDTEDIRSLMRMSLERAGFDVVADAEDGEEAIVVAGEHKPDLILLDLHMPGLGGLEALPGILRASPRSRVVVFSAMAATRMLEAALDAGASAYIVKGVSPKRIAEHLHRVAKSGSVRPVQPWPLAGG
jgi:DNA-binding NarL/FixJ family response regulator